MTKRMIGPKYYYEQNNIGNEYTFLEDGSMFNE